MAVLQALHGSYRHKQQQSQVRPTASKLLRCSADPRPPHACLPAEGTLAAHRDGEIGYGNEHDEDDEEAPLRLAH